MNEMTSELIVALQKCECLVAHMTGKAHVAYQRFSHEIWEPYAMSKDTLWMRFEPASKVECYKAELQRCTKKDSESWADFGDEFLLLVEQAFPEFLEQTRDVIALDHFLGQPQLPQISLYVKQYKPKSVKEAVNATLEVESYWLSIDWECEISANTSNNDEPIQQLESIIKVLENLQLRLVNLESTVHCTQHNQFKIEQLFVTNVGSPVILLEDVHLGNRSKGSKKQPVAKDRQRTGYTSLLCY